MTTKANRRWIVIGLLALGAAMNRPAEAQPLSDAAPLPSEPGVETLLQGPIHEAFAKPIDVDPSAGIVTAKEPPAPVQELPPEVKPEGEDSIWISGYWAWEPEREDFVWISGVWRLPPPGQRWIPGYWTEAESGYQWIAGFWAPMEVEQVDYLPVPPESLDHGPTSPQPSESYFWVSGCWIWRDGAYAWRPGYWAPYYEQWVWVPAHYVWTPQGCIFVEGFWDYTIVERGQVFAPVYFDQVVYTQPTYVYSPRVALNVSNLLVHLFVNPSHGHYYCGDYYGTRYRDRGFQTWSSYYSRPAHFDPLFAYYNTYYRTQGVNYVERLEQWHTYYERNEAVRPPRTLREQVQLVSQTVNTNNININNNSIQNAILGQTVDQLLEGRNTQRRYQRVAEEQRRELAQSARDLRQVIEARAQVEVAADSLTADARQADVAQPNGRQEDDRQADARQRDPQAQSRGANAAAKRARLRLPQTPRLAAQNAPGAGSAQAPPTTGTDGEQAPTTQPGAVAGAPATPPRPDRATGADAGATAETSPGGRSTPPRPDATADRPVPGQPDRSEATTRRNRPSATANDSPQAPPSRDPETGDRRPRQPGATAADAPRPRREGTQPGDNLLPPPPGARSDDPTATGADATLPGAPDRTQRPNAQLPNDRARRSDDLNTAPEALPEERRTQRPTLPDVRETPESREPIPGAGRDTPRATPDDPRSALPGVTPGLDPSNVSPRGAPSERAPNNRSTRGANELPTLPPRERTGREEDAFAPRTGRDRPTPRIPGIEPNGRNSQSALDPRQDDPARTLPPSSRGGASSRTLPPSVRGLEDRGSRPGAGGQLPSSRLDEGRSPTPRGRTLSPGFDQQRDAGRNESPYRGNPANVPGGSLGRGNSSSNERPRSLPPGFGSSNSERSTQPRLDTQPRFEAPSGAGRGNRPESFDSAPRGRSVEQSGQERGRSSGNNSAGRSSRSDERPDRNDKEKNKNKD